jgi:hypothetical protein
VIGSHEARTKMPRTINRLTPLRVAESARGKPF